MIELRGRGNIRVNLSTGVDQNRGSMKAGGLQKAGQQGVLVLAIAVLVREHFRSRVGLVSSESERQADVTELEGDKIVKSLHFLHVGRLALYEFLFFSTDLRTGLAALAFEAGIPTPNFFPTGERGQLYGGLFGFLPSAFLLKFFLGIHRGVRGSPVINLAIALFRNFRLVLRARL